MSAQPDRPLIANDPNWPVVDLEFTDAEWHQVILIARYQGIPVAQYIRRAIRIGLELEESNHIEPKEA